MSSPENPEKPESVEAEKKPESETKEVAESKVEDEEDIKDVSESDPDAVSSRSFPFIFYTLPKNFLLSLICDL